MDRDKIVQMLGGRKIYYGILFKNGWKKKEESNTCKCSANNGGSIMLRGCCDLNRDMSKVMSRNIHMIK